MSSSPSELRRATELICDQFCRAAAGDIEIQLQVTTSDVTAQKLALLGNGVLEVARRAVRDALAKEREREAAVEMAQLGSWRVDLVAGHQHFTWSPELHRIAGTTPEQFVPCAETVRALIHPADRERVWGAHARALAGSAESYDLRLLSPDGQLKRLWTELRPIVEAGRVIGFRAISQDVTERFAVEARIRHLAEHDALTGLINRATLHQRIDAMLERRRDGTLRGRRIAVLCLDLDGFKAINDRYGHAAGDQVLVQAGERIRRLIRGTDIAARLGGDEFAIVFTSPALPEAAVGLGRRVVNALSLPYDLPGGAENAVISASVGVAVYPDDGMDTDTILRAADTAMYCAKELGPGEVRLFEAGMEEQARARRQVEIDLRAALSRGELRLVYQPLVTVDDGSVQGFEALLRWEHPELGSIPPDEFIPIAEASGTIVQIGAWVLQEACREAARWSGGLFVAVNVSPLEIQRGAQFASTVHDALEASGLPPGRLELEVTEGLLIRNRDAALEALGRVRDLGVRIALDDFGTGYSSLATLRSFPFDKLKVDRRFIAGMGGRSAEDEAIVRAVLGLARGLALPVVAEGVETQDQLQALRKERCAEAQGWLFGRPGPVPEHFLLSTG